MPINTPSFAYPFDPKAELTSNLIVNEQHIISAIQGKHYQKIVPRWAPFYQKDLRLRFRAPNGQVRDLIEGQDYYLGHRFLSASRSTGYPIYGSINIIDRSLQGTVVIDQYRTLGGSWTIDQPQIMKILADQLYNPRIVTWEFVIERPINFPVTAHEWDIVDMKGATHVVEALGGVRDALYQRNTDNIEEHIRNFDNPHQVTAAQLNAVTVPVYTAGLATKLDKNATSVNSALLDGRDVSTLTAEILAGTAHNSQRLDGKSLNEVRSYVLLGKAADADRVYGMTSAQFDVYIRERMAEMTVMEVTATNTERFSGYTFEQAKAEILLGTAHDTERVYGMTEVQFDAYLKELLGEMTELEVTATNTERFDGRTYPEARADILSGKVADSTLFNGLTQAQYYAQILNNLADESVVEVNVTDSSKLDGLTRAQLTAAILSGTADNSERFAGMSLSEFDIYVGELFANLGTLPGTAENALRLEGQTLAEVLTLASQTPAENAEKLGGLTRDELISQTLMGTAADAERFDGMTSEDYVNYVAGEITTDFAQGYALTASTTQNFSEVTFLVATGRLPISGSGAVASSGFHALVNIGLGTTPSAWSLALTPTGGTATRLTGPEEQPMEFYSVVGPFSGEEVYEDSEGNSYAPVKVYMRLTNPGPVTMNSISFGGQTQNHEPVVVTGTYNPGQKLPLSLDRNKMPVIPQFPEIPDVPPIPYTYFTVTTASGQRNIPNGYVITGGMTFLGSGTGNGTGSYTAVMDSAGSVANLSQIGNLVTWSLTHDTDPPITEIRIYIALDRAV